MEEPRAIEITWEEYGKMSNEEQWHCISSNGKLYKCKCPVCGHAGIRSCSARQPLGWQSEFKCQKCDRTLLCSVGINDMDIRNEPNYGRVS